MKSSQRWRMKLNIVATHHIVGPKSKLERAGHAHWRKILDVGQGDFSHDVRVSYARLPYNFERFSTSSFSELFLSRIL